MFSRSKGEKAKRHLDSDEKRPKHSLSQLGLLEIPSVSDLALGGSVDDDDDASLEAELLALTGGQNPQRPKKSKGVAAVNLDQMIAECMNDNYDDEPIDEDDPELLAELSALGPQNDEEEESGIPLLSEKPSPDHSDEVPSPPKRPTPAIVRPSPFLAGSSVAILLKERIQMYKEAEENALGAGETSRAKRFTRGLRNMNQMLKDVNAGVAVNEENIPPPVLTKSSRNNSALNLSEQPIPPSSDSPCPSAPSTIPQSVAFTPDRLSAPQLPPHQSIPHEEKGPEVGVQSHHPTVDSTIPQITPIPPSPKGNFPQDPSPDLPPHPSPSESLPPATTNPPSLPPQPPSDPLSSALKRQQEYKAAALAAKKDGDRAAAINFMRTAKQLDPLIQAAKEGQPVDLQSLPPPPSQALRQPLPQALPVPSSSQQGSPPTEVSSEKGGGETIAAPLVPSANPSSPKTILEALEQRLEKYTEQRDKAKEAGDSRKERMNHRIMKQFQEAIKAHKCGRAVILEDLPTPPGFPPFPTEGAVHPLASSPAALGPTPTAPDSTRPQSIPQKPPAQNSQLPPAGAVTNAQPPIKSDVRKAPQSRVERQLSVLVRRQGQFKEAALEAKRRGEVEQAKEYLRNYKGFDQLIAATNGGLPVDMNTVPIPPQEKMGTVNTSLDFEVIDKEDCVFVPPETKADVALAFTKLEEDLISQIKMCAHTREHFKVLGDVASTNRFEQLIVHTKKDLDAVRVAFRRGDNPPRFHYENRTFTIIQCNTDLSDSDCEVTVVRGLNFNVSNPTDVDTYVKIEFPYPTDAPPQERSNVIKDTNNPEFNHKVVFSIDRKARALSRVFKRHSVKGQVIAKGGWFHRDSVLGTAKIPLVALETKCTLHESFDLMDEKKKMVGGKLEVKIRVRNPILSKQLEKVTEKWVVIDGF